VRETDGAMAAQHESGTNVVERLYEAFGAGDWRTMRACYAPDATFRDPVFELHGAEEIGRMWRMLVERGTDLEVSVRDIAADTDTGRAHWEARYTFSTGRAVHNVIEARFSLRDDRIVEHVDMFGFWRWSRQALGPLGLVLGWTPFVRGRVQAAARRGLTAFEPGGG
jgi:ketosteroid isomerase-like protein